MIGRSAYAGGFFICLYFYINLEKGPRHQEGRPTELCVKNGNNVRISGSQAPL